VQTLLGVPVTQITDAQLYATLLIAPRWDGLSLAEDLAGLSGLRHGYPLTYAEIARRVQAEDPVGWAWLEAHDLEILELALDARELVTLLEEEAVAARRIRHTVAAELLEASAEWLRFDFRRALAAHRVNGPAALFQWQQLVGGPPQERARLIEEQAREAQHAVAARRRLKQLREDVGTLWLGSEVVGGLGAVRTLEAVLAPRDGTETEHEAIAFARLWPETCAVAQRGARWYVYRLSGSALAYPQVWEHEEDQDTRSVLVPVGDPRPRVVLSDGYVLRADGGSYVGGDQSQFPRPFFDGGLAVLQRIGELPEGSALPLFEQLCFDLLLIKLADAATHVAAALRDLDTKPDRPAELRLLTGALRTHLQTAREMADELDDRSPTPQELDRLVATMTSIGDLTSQDPVAATLVVADDDAIVDPYADAGMTLDAVKAHAREKLAQRRANIDVVRRRMHRAPGEVLTFQHLHEEVLLRFPLQEMLDIGDTLHWRPYREFGAGLLEFGAVLALSVAAAMTGGAVALIAAGAGFGMSAADTVTAFRNAREMAAMAEIGLKGDVVLATPDEVAWARRWAWISVAFAVLDAGQFIHEADKLARVRELLKTPDLHAALGTSGRTLRRVARDVGLDEDVLIDLLERLDGPGRDRLLLKIRRATGARSAGSRAVVAVGRATGALLRDVERILRTRDLATVFDAANRGGPHTNLLQLAVVKRYLFDSPGIAVTEFNVAWWKRLAGGTASVADMAVLQHELAEVAHLQASKFDFLGRGLKGPPDDAWLVGFTKHQLAAHAHALQHEYEYMAGSVRAAASGEIDLPREVVAAIDPRGASAAGNSDPYIHLRTQGSSAFPSTRLRADPRLGAWRARGSEPVVLHPTMAARLGVTSPVPLAELIDAVKRSSPTVTPAIVGDLLDAADVPDARTAARGGIRRIMRFVDRAFGRGKEVDEIHIEGRILRPIPRRDAPNYNTYEEWAAIRDDFPELADYQAAHLWGPGFGDEAYAGVLLAPSEFNLRWQNAGIEERIRNLYRDVTPLGGEVHLRATVKNHGRDVARGFTLAEVSYVVEVRHNGRVRWQGRVTASVDKPPGRRVVVDLDPGDWPPLPDLTTPPTP